MIDNFSAGGIDEDAAIVHGCQKLVVHHSDCFGCGRQVNGNCVTAACQFERRGAIPDTQLCRSLLGQAATPGHHFHAQAFRSTDHFLADHADPENTQRTAAQSACLAVFFLAPFAVSQVVRCPHNPPITGDQQTDGQFRHCGTVLTRAVGHVDATLAGLLDVNGIDARSRADNQRQLLCRHGWFLR